MNDKIIDLAERRRARLPQPTRAEICMRIARDARQEFHRLIIGAFQIADEFGIGALAQNQNVEWVAGRLE